MAEAGEVIPEALEYQILVLKVSIHCEGCKRQVKRALQHIEGVYKISIDSQQQKVVITGSVTADVLLKKLAKAGKRAELWPEKKPPENKNKSKSEGKAKEERRNSGGSGDGVGACRQPVHGKAAGAGGLAIQQAVNVPAFNASQLPPYLASYSTVQPSMSHCRAYYHAMPMQQSGFVHPAASPWSYYHLSEENADACSIM
ncbi:hypothetical protein Cni_G12033 [Canna indica]|uniref:HMA domain-containing protein n=1 Tax=Canna indica TaxID=4628 RepID=A0AAQ3QBR3_9LILI|nr:hypothetical protein Cni_G12033 [Canna indica]